MKPLETYKKGDKVKVDRGGSGDGVQFLTINEGFKTDNCNGYKDYNFDELDKKIRISEYHIRLINKDDLALKKLYDEQNIVNFEFDYDLINRTFWESQKENIKKCRDYVDNFLHPYLTKYKNTIPVEKMTDWDAYYKKAMHTKNRYIFVIPHEHLNIIVFQGTTYIDLIITAPDNLETPDRRRRLGIFTMGTEFSDEEYVQVMSDVTKLIIADYEKELVKKSAQNYTSYFIHPDYKVVDKLKSYKHIMLKGDYNDHQNMPSSQYIYVLRELNYIKHYCFNKRFE